MRVCVKYEDDISVFETKSVLCTVDIDKDLYGDKPVYLLSFGDLYEYKVNLNDVNHAAIQDGIKWLNKGLTGGVFIIKPGENEICNVSFDSVNFT
jgi:hypothetical protein